MARVYLTRRQKIDGNISNIAAWARKQMRINGVTVSQLAEELDVSEVSIYKQFKQNKITFPMFIAICNMCQSKPDEIERIMKI